MSDIEREVISLASKIIKIPENKISLDSDLFSDLGVDSLLGVEILAALDKKYGIDIPETKLNEARTLRDIVNYVKELAKKHENPSNI